MICFEAQTAIVNPSKERPVWHWGIHSFGNDFLLAGSTFGRNVVGDPALTFIRHFICFFPHANCSTWSYADRFGLENVNSQIRETNRQLQCWGNKYNILKLWTVCVCVCVKDCGWTMCLSVDAFACARTFLSLGTLMFMCWHLRTHECSPDKISNCRACRCVPLLRLCAYYW